MTGRGAWPVSGSGGTKKYKDAAKPGPYYYLGTGQTVDDPNTYAVHQAVKAYQRALTRRTGHPLTVDGVFGQVTSNLVTSFQKKHPEVGVWGGIGPDTSKALLYPDLVKEVEKQNFSHLNVVSGIIKTESFWDAGAVGYLDETDFGLAQINGPAHPSLSDAKRLKPKTSFKFVINYVRNALNQFNNDLELTIASYNLGIGGARVWNSAGRPDVYTPPGASRPRNVRQYIDNILAG